MLSEEQMKIIGHWVKIISKTSSHKNDYGVVTGVTLRKVKYMEFYPTNEYREVTLQAGLNSVQLGNTDKLFSDGLEEDEYIYFDDSKGFCYEDGCVIGGTYDKTLNVLHELKWCFNHKFYVKI